MLDLDPQLIVLLLHRLELLFVVPLLQDHVLVLPFEAIVLVYYV